MPSTAFSNTRSVELAIVDGRFFDDFVLDETWAFIVLKEAHGEVATSLGEGAEIRDITEHFGKWNFAVDLLGIATLGLANHVATATSDITDDIAIILLWNGDFDLHDRLKEDWVALLGGFFEGQGGSDFISGLGGVDIMVGTIEQGALDVDGWVTSDQATLHGLFETLLGWLDVFFRNDAADDGIDELEAFAGVWFETDPNVTILTMAARLFDITALGLAHLADGFAIVDLWRTDVDVDFEFAAHTVDEDVEGGRSRA